MNIKKLPIIAFPTPVLPGGRVVLHVIHPQEQALAKVCCAQGGLGLMMTNSTKNNDFNRILSIGAYAEMVDFYNDMDGIPHLVFEAKQRIQIVDIHHENNLKIANTIQLPAWLPEKISTQEQELANQLRAIYQQHPELNLLYIKENFEDSTWVCQRWLEIIQMPTLEKYRLLSKPSVEETKAFLTEYLAAATESEQELR